MFTLAHLSDPHVGPLPSPRVRDLLNKRVLGYLSWKVRRHSVHSPDVLDAMADDLRSTNVDHVAVTGDITNIALPEEFAQSARWLHSLGEPRDVTVIPGNHDCYIAVPWATSFAHWAPFMHSDETAADDGEAFPVVRVRGDVAIVGVTTAQPTAPFLATGSLGAIQLERLRKVLAELDERRLFRVVLIHHPPGANATKTRKRLVDATELCDVLAEVGAELVLHGHTHHSSVDAIDGPAGAISVVGVSSASAGHAADAAHRSRYHLYRIERGKDGWNVELEIRRLHPDRLAFVVEDQRELISAPLLRALQAGVGE